MRRRDRQLRSSRVDSTRNKQQSHVRLCRWQRRRVQVDWRHNSNLERVAFVRRRRIRARPSDRRPRAHRHRLHRLGLRGTARSRGRCLDKCIALSVPGASQAINAVFTNGNGTMTTTLYDDSACSVVSKNQSVSTPAKLAQCEAQPPAKYGVCTKVVPECVAAFSAKYSGVSVGSFKYMEVSQVITPTTSKSSAMTVGISAF
ncbi:hypothetical protein HDU99_001869, partial [Rhizoclosmatium hyalinum]